MQPESKFFERSHKIAKRFLQTAVVIDDRAFRPTGTVESVPETVLSPPTPSTTPPDPVLFSESASLSVDKSPVTLSDPDPHALNAQAVIESFAQHGIVCSVLQRFPDENPAEPGQSARQLLDPADILIIDWQFRHPDGYDTHEETLEFLETAVTTARTFSPQHLRVTIVYTGAQNLLTVVDKIEERLQGIKEVAVTKDGSFAFRVGAARIVVVGKPGGYRTAEAKQQQVENDAALADWATREFTKMTAGLVSNVVLEGLSEIRRATHRILTRFEPALDAPFLAHRTLTDPPAEANEHLLPLLSAELQAILESASVALEPSNEAIYEWFADRLQERITKGIDTREPGDDAALQLLYLMEHGVDHCLSEGMQLPWLGHWSAHRNKATLDEAGVDGLPDLFQGAPVPDAHARLAELMALRPRYGSSPPMLTLGTVLESHETSIGKKPTVKKTYWLCMQPVCDCVRLSKPRAFPLMPLQRKQSGWFSLSIGVDGQYLRLRLDPRPHETKMIEFVPSANSHTITANIDDEGRWWFGEAEANPRWRWIGELKSEQALRAVQSSANQNARVGLTESEWQRRRASH